MTAHRIQTLIIASVMAGFASPSLAEDATVSSATPLPTTVQVLATPLPASGSPLKTPYSGLQEAWDNCFNIKSTCAELLDEGRFAPARKAWVDFYASSLEQSIANIKIAYLGTQFPPSVQTDVSSSWTSAGTATDAMAQSLQELQTVAASMKTPTDDKYPPAFWSPTRSILNKATDLDKSLVEMLAVLENRIPVVATSATKLQGSLSSNAGSTGLDGLMSASTKVSDAAEHLAAELDRLNLSWGKAPTSPLSDEFYQGAFTKQEILSQYKYMPSFVFTTDPSVARFTYRMPPRRNMLAHYAVQIGGLLNIMDSEMQSIQAAVPASKSAAVAAPWTAMQQKYTDARNQYMKLYTLLNATTDAKLAVNIMEDQKTFGAPVLALREDMDQLRSATNDFMAIVQAK